MLLNKKERKEEGKTEGRERKRQREMKKCQICVNKLVIGI
jgi:hypothetical protein